MARVDMSQLAADMLLESPRSRVACTINIPALTNAVEDTDNEFHEISPLARSPTTTVIPIHSPSLSRLPGKTRRSMPSLQLNDNAGRHSTLFSFKSKRTSLSRSFTASAKSPSKSFSMTSVRRKSMIYRAPTVSSQRDIRAVCFYLAIHGILLGFLAWSVNILIALLYANECELFHANGDITFHAFLYCSLISDRMVSTCSQRALDPSTVAFFSIGCVCALSTNLFGSIFALLWKLRVPDLSALSSRQRSIGQSLLKHRHATRVNRRTLVAWLLIIVLCACCLAGEYHLDNTYFCRHMTGGRDVYRLVVIFSSVFLFKCIEAITEWEFAVYAKTKRADRKRKQQKRKSKDSKKLVANPTHSHAQFQHGQAKRNRKYSHSDAYACGYQYGEASQSPYSPSEGDATDTSSTASHQLKDMLQAVQETDDELITSQKRTVLFRRDLMVFMVNTSIGVLLPALHVYPWQHAWNASTEEIQIFADSLVLCVGEATKFIYGACISSQTTALVIELAMKWIYNKLEKEYMPLIPRDSSNSGEYIADCRKDRVIVAIFEKVAAKHIHGLYVTHENWFILMVIFLWQCQFGWLNPNMFVLGSLTMLVVTIIYKLRFTFLKPRIEKQFIAHCVRHECVSFMLYLYIPMQCLLLLPFANAGDSNAVQCRIVVFALPLVSLLITVLNAVIYKACLRTKRTPYLVAITKQWNNIENKLTDTRGMKSVAM